MNVFGNLLGRTLGGGALGLEGYVRQTLQLPTANLLNWYNASNGVYEDTLLTDVAEDGDAVAGWADQSANALHVTQGTAGDRPIYRANVAALNNKPAIEFVSSDYLIRNATGVIANLNVYTIYVVFVTSSVGAVGYFYSEGKSDSPTQFAAVRHNVAAAEGFHRSDASVTANPTGGTTANNGVKHLLTVRRIGATSWSVRLDGVQVGTDNDAVGTTTTDRIAIGALIRSTISLHFTGHIAQIANYSADNFATIEPLLAAHYGIILP